MFLWVFHLSFFKLFPEVNKYFIWLLKLGECCNLVLILTWFACINLKEVYSLANSTQSAALKTFVDGSFRLYWKLLLLFGACWSL